MVRAMRGKLAPVIGIRRKKDEQAKIFAFRIRLFSWASVRPTPSM